jgi:hypothetical protein
VEVKVFNPSDILVTLGDVTIEGCAEEEIEHTKLDKLLALIGETAYDYLREGYSNPEILARLRDLLLDAYEQKWITEKPSRLTAYRWGGTLYINHCGEALGPWLRRVWNYRSEKW